MTYFAIFTMVLVALLLVSERRGDPVGRAYFKIMASTSFVGCAIAAGCWATFFGRWILVGLLLSWLGDAFLLSRRKGPFLGGLVSFLLAHVAYGVAFVTLGVDLEKSLFAAVVLAVIGFRVARWLVRQAGPGMRVPLLAYVIVISAMVAAGIGAAAATAGAATVGDAGWLAGILLMAPLAFYLSDLAVARDRFVARSFINRLWGLPLYYTAQVLFAVSARLVQS